MFLHRCIIISIQGNRYDHNLIWTARLSQGGSGRSLSNSLSHPSSPRLSDGYHQPLHRLHDLPLHRNHPRRHHLLQARRWRSLRGLYCCSEPSTHGSPAWRPEPSGRATVSCQSVPLSHRRSAASHLDHRPQDPMTYIWSPSHRAATAHVEPPVHAHLG